MLAGLCCEPAEEKDIEEPFGWGKTIGGLARPMLRGVEKLGFTFTLMMADYNRSPSMSGNRISRNASITFN